MVKITNGVGAPIEVTRGAYEGHFKSLGYFPADDDTSGLRASGAVTDTSNQQPAEDQDENDDMGDAADEFEELIQKPIGQWSKNEIKEFAAAKAIDLSGTKNIGDAKALISEYLQAQE